MSNGVWISVVGIGVLALVFFLLVAKPSEEDKRQAEEITRRQSISPGSEPEQAAAVSGAGQAPSSTAVAGQNLASEPWRMWGWVLTAIGGLGLGFSLFLKTSIETYVPPTLLGSGGTSEVVNLDLLFQKGVAIAGSLTAIGVGIFCIAVSAIVGAIENAGKK